MRHHNSIVYIEENQIFNITMVMFPFRKSDESQPIFGCFLATIQFPSYSIANLHPVILKRLCFTFEQSWSETRWQQQKQKQNRGEIDKCMDETDPSEDYSKTLITVKFSSQYIKHQIQKRWARPRSAKASGEHPLHAVNHFLSWCFIAIVTQQEE